MKHSKSWVNVDQSLNMNSFYEHGLHLIKEGNELLAKEIMIFYNELSFRIYNPPRISYKNMASFPYNTVDLLSLTSNESSRQSTSVYIPVNPRGRNYKVVSFSNAFNPLLLEINVFVCTSKAYMFPPADDIFRSDIRSPVSSRESFVCTTPVSSHVRSSLVPPIAFRNCKNIRNRSIHCNSVSSSSVNVDRVS